MTGEQAGLVDLAGVLKERFGLFLTYHDAAAVVAGLARGYVMVPRRAAPAMLAAVAQRVEPATLEDYADAKAALGFLAPSDHPDVADILAELARDYRAFIEARPGQMAAQMEPPAGLAELWACAPPTANATRHRRATP